jgi:hypothetical protein
MARYFTQSQGAPGSARGVSAEDKLPYEEMVRRTVSPADLEEARPFKEDRFAEPEPPEARGARRS